MGVAQHGHGCVPGVRALCRAGGTQGIAGLVPADSTAPVIAVI